MDTALKHPTPAHAKSEGTDSTQLPFSASELAVGPPTVGEGRGVGEVGAILTDGLKSEGSRKVGKQKSKS